MVIRAPTYDFILYPQKAGRLKLDAFRVRYQIDSYSSVGSEENNITLSVSVPKIEVGLPPGLSEDTFALVTPEFNLSVIYQPDTA
jgi:hypothetical protein